MVLFIKLPNRSNLLHMKQILISLLVILNYTAFAQTWSDDVAAIVYDKCSKCHHTGGVGPFPLTTYTEASSMAIAMHDAISTDEMPPWPPNNNYNQYVHDRSLSPSEKTTMLNWLLNGTPQGNASNTPPPPVFPTGSILGAGDLEIQIPTYMSKALSSGDDYVCFAMPSNLPTDRIVKSVEIVPGNRQIVHHALIYVDPSGSSVTDTVGGDCGGPNSTSAALVMGYTPGSSPLALPSSPPLKLGMTIPANSQIVFAMHYPEGSYGQYDSTKVIFHFYPPGETGIREIYASPVLQNWSMVIPPNQVTNVSAQYPASGGLPIDYSILSVFPHMHLLGQEMKVYGVESNLDTLKMIDIPHWDFEWQDFYFFKNMVHATAGTTFYAEGSYDNTSGNIHNPNNPPQTVYAGLNTTDEMFLVYNHFMPYFPGDENYNMDSLMNLSSASIIEESLDGNQTFNIYPNPFSNATTIESNNLKPGDQVTIYLYNNQGKLVSKLQPQTTVSTNQIKINWDGTNDQGSKVESGIYYLSININGELQNQRLVKY